MSLHSSLIRAGTIEQLTEASGDWLIVDIGFAKATNRSCGILSHNFTTQTTSVIASPISYGKLRTHVAECVQQSSCPLHLVIEAPLSAAFDDSGNPIGRDPERRGEQHRYWYAGLGCSVLVASLYLMKEILLTGPSREVRLFEGFVSYKPERTCHDRDAKALLKVIQSKGADGGRFIRPEPASGSCRYSCASVFELLGLDRSPPPIIEVIEP